MTNLINKTYKCNVPKLEMFANGVLKLAFQGQQVVLTHEKLTGTNTSITLAMKEWSDMVYALRGKLDSLKTGCYDNIDTFIAADVEHPKYQTIASHENAVQSMKRNLKEKYPWLHWTIISYRASNNNQKGKQQFLNRRCPPYY